MWLENSWLWPGARPPAGGPGRRRPRTGRREEEGAGGRDGRPEEAEWPRGRRAPPGRGSEEAGSRA